MCKSHIKPLLCTFLWIIHKRMCICINPLEMDSHINVLHKTLIKPFLGSFSCKLITKLFLHERFLSFLLAPFHNLLLNCIRIFLCRNYETFSRKKCNFSKYLIHGSGYIHQRYNRLICSFNTDTDQRMKRMYQDEKDFSVMPGVPSWACVASAICIKAFSFLLNRILTRWTSPYTPVGIEEKFRLFVLKTQFTANNTLSADLRVLLLKAEGDSKSSHAQSEQTCLRISLTLRSVSDVDSY